MKRKIVVPKIITWKSTSVVIWQKFKEGENSHWVSLDFWRVMLFVFFNELLCQRSMKILKIHMWVYLPSFFLSIFRARGKEREKHRCRWNACLALGTFYPWLLCEVNTRENWDPDIWQIPQGHRANTRGLKVSTCVSLTPKSMVFHYTALPQRDWF